MEGRFGDESSMYGAVRDIHMSDSLLFKLSKVLCGKWVGIIPHSLSSNAR